jgi:hypothetical protein
MTIREALTEAAVAGEYALTFADGFDACILGLASHFGERGHEQRVLYDKNKMIEQLAAEMDDDYDAANEHFDFNIAGAYVGPSTPAFLERPEI